MRLSVPATAARVVVQQFLDKGGRNDVIRLVGTYEVGLYGMSRFQSTSGYEQRRQAALAEVSSSRLKAAAAASAAEASAALETRCPGIACVVIEYEGDIADPGPALTECVSRICPSRSCST